MPLHIKHRPQDLESFVGNESTTNALAAILNREDHPHSFLFTGPSGCGKTTLARIVKNMLGCSDGNFKEIDSADFRGIDSIREIRRTMRLVPLGGGCRVWLLDECHKMTNDAQNALLKALEDTPPHVYFLLATTDPQKLLKTIRTRCSTFEVSLLSEERIASYLKRVVRQEERKIETESLELIARNSLGSMRAALVMLEKVIDLAPADRSAAIEQAAKEESEVIELCRALLKKDSWKKISSILKGLQDQEPESIRYAVIGYCKSVLLNSGQERAGLIIDEFWEPFFNVGHAGLASCCFRCLKF